MSVSIAALEQALKGRYVVGRHLGSGGMASVFLATDVRHQREVAIKVLRPEVAFVSGPDRFAREVGIVARLTHPNIVPLYDSGVTDGIAWFAMPFVEGRSLHALLKERGVLAPAEAVRIALEVAEALSYAHARGIVHRDIKPDNILLESGHAVVADFGIARAVEVGTGGTTTAPQAFGTPAYMSPEQASSEHDVDGRSDIYSLGLVLHEMLSGQLPPRSVTPMSGRPIAPRRDRSGVPRAFHAVINKAIASEVGDRFATIEEFSDALRTAASRHSSSRTRWGVGLTGTLVIAALITFVVLQDRATTGRTMSPRRIVIAPLDNRTGQASLDQVGQIAADWLTGGLQQTGIVEIVPSETAFEVQRQVREEAARRRIGDPVRALAQETGAGIAVTGAFYLQGDRLSLRIQVTDAIRGRLLEAPENVVAPVNDPTEGIVALRSRLMGWLAVHYDERLRGHTTTVDAPPTWDAYRAFAAGMEHYLANRNAAALPLFQEAYALDSTFAPSLLYTSLTLTNLGRYVDADSLLQQAARRRAELSEYHRAWLDSRAAFVAGHNEAALRAIRRAAELAPESKAVYNRAVAAFQAGHLGEAHTALGQLTPDHGPMRGFLPYWDLLGAVEHAIGDHRNELRAGREARKRFPDRMAAVLPVIRALAATKNAAGLRQVLGEARALPPDPIGWSWGDLLMEVATELAAHGDSVGAVAALQEAEAWLKSESGAAPGLAVRVAYGLGDWERVERLLDSLPDVLSGVERLGMRGLVAARRGERALAVAALDSLARSSGRHEFGAAPLYGARIAAVLGQQERSVAMLRRAFEEGKEFDLWLHREQDFAGLRRYAPFQALLRPRS